MAGAGPQISALLTCLLLIVSCREGYPEGYVALCVIVKNQAADLQEWLQYHRFIGISRVYLYDNNSTKPLAYGIRGHLHSGYVHYTYLAASHKHSRAHAFASTPQWQAYDDCIKRHRHKHRWLGFLDVDEFVVLHTAADAADTETQQDATEAQARPDIRALLSQYEAFGGLALNWVMFGSNGHLQRPRGGVLVSYHACLPLQHSVHAHVKVFANTAHVATIGSTPHHVVFSSPNVFTVNELKQQVNGPFSSPPSHTRASIYHYVTKSKREYLLKMKRGAGDGTRKNKAFFASTNADATATCISGRRLGPACCSDMLQRELGSEGVADLMETIASLSADAVDASIGSSATRTA